MSTFRKLAAAVIVLFMAVIAGLNIYLLRSGDSGTYRVEAKRLADRIEETGSTDISEFPHLTGVYSGEQLYRSDEHYLIIEAGGKLYRVEYTTEGRNRTVWAVNCVLAALFLLILILLVYIRRNIIVPFGRLNTVPQELAKGNLAVPIPE